MMSIHAEQRIKKTVLYTNILLHTGVLFYFVFITQYRLGEYIYPIDDAYIHLALAHNFSEYGIWGATPYEFSSTSSSPLFTVILSGLIGVFGNHSIISLILNIIFSYLIIYITHLLLKHRTTLVYSLGLSSVVWLTPLFVITLSGMEHVLHTFFMLMSVWALKKYWNNASVRNFMFLSVAGFLSVSLRYESLFFFLFVCLLLFFVRKDFAKSFTLGLVCLLPVILYGIFSISQGSYFFPNSLLVKANINEDHFFSRLGLSFYKSHALLPFVGVLFILLWLSFRKENIKSFFNNNYIQICVFGNFILHFLLAEFGWLYRYEAYLLVLLIIAISLDEKLRFKRLNVKGITILLLIFAIPFYSRTVRSFVNFGRAPKNIFQQQIQMGKFLNRYYNTSKVVANDIGAISYLSKIHLFDVVGLASKEIVEARKENKDITDITAFIKAYTDKNNYDIALVYDTWVKMPDTAVKVGTWKISDNYVCGLSVVSIYAIKKENASQLYHNLVDFNKYIDKGVQVKLIKPTK